MKQKQYSVSLVYQKQTSSEFLFVLKAMIVHASSEAEALGIGIKLVDKELKGYSLGLKTVVEVRQENHKMRVCYIAHPIGGDVVGNLKKIDAIVRQINLEEPDVVPFVPYYADIMAMDDAVQAERLRGMANDREFFERGTMDEVRVYGDRISVGVAEEIRMALAAGIPVVPMNKAVYDEYYNRK